MPTLAVLIPSLPQAGEARYGFASSDFCSMNLPSIPTDEDLGHVFQRLHHTLLFLISVSSAIVRSSSSICRKHAIHCSQRLSFRCFTKANMSALRNSSQHSNFGESSETARTSSGKS